MESAEYRALAQEEIDRARRAFDREDFILAASHYGDAENLWNRAGNPTRAFFAWSRRMQALRKADSDSFADQFADSLEAGLVFYRQHISKNADYRRDCIRYGKILEERMDRLKALGEYTQAFWAGQRLLTFVEGYDDVLDLNPVMPLIWKCEVGMLEIRHKKGTGISLAQLADLYEQLASVPLAPSEGRPISPRLRETLKAFRLKYLSDARKYRAFSYIEGAVTLDKLTTAAKTMSLSARLAERAATRFKELGDDRRGSPLNGAYLRYWLAVFRLRRAMQRHKWALAKKEIVAAESEATRGNILVEGEYRPHYFLGLTDLKNERYLIEASVAASRGSVKRCLDHLDEWIRGASEYAGHWRYENVRVRFLSMGALDAMLTGQAGRCNELLGQAHRLIEAGRLGSAAAQMTKIVEAASYLTAMGQTIDRNSLLRRLAMYLPIDFYPEPEMTIERPDPLSYLPRSLRSALEDCVTGYPTTQQRNAVRHLTRAYVATVCEYVEARKERLAAAREMREVHPTHTHATATLDELLEVLRETWERSRDRRSWIDELEDAVRKMSTDEEWNPADVAAELRDNVIRPTLRWLFPLVIQAVEVAPVEGVAISRARRLSPSGSTNYLTVRAIRGLIEGQYYMLPAKWKQIDHPRAVYPATRPEFPIYRCGTGLILDPSPPRPVMSGFRRWHGDGYELRRAKEGGEYEVKFVMRQDLAEWVVALANTFGGHLVVGLSNDFDQITGLRAVNPLSPSQLEAAANGLSSALKSVDPTPIIPTYYTCPFEAEGGDVFVIEVNHAPSDQNEPYTLGQRTYFRDGASKQTYLKGSPICAARWKAARAQLVQRALQQVRGA